MMCLSRLFPCYKLFYTMAPTYLRVDIGKVVGPFSLPSNLHTFYSNHFVQFLSLYSPFLAMLSTLIKFADKSEMI